MFATAKHCPSSSRPIPTRPSHLFSGDFDAIVCTRLSSFEARPDGQQTRQLMFDEPNTQIDVI